MPDRRLVSLHLGALDDAALAEALRDLGREVAVPGPSTLALAAAVRATIGSMQPRRATTVWGASKAILWRTGSPRRWSGLGRLRRSAVLAFAAVLVIATVAAAAIGFALPGLRIIFGPPPSVAPATASPEASLPRPPGAGIGLGAAIPLDDARALVDFPVVVPTDPDLGPPDVVYSRLGRLALVWAPRAGLPATTDPTVGLLLSEFRGRVEEGFILKIADAGTQVEPVDVGGTPGYWIDGEPHFFLYIDPAGAVIEDSYRVVGDTLVWTRDGVTYRLETSLGRVAAIRIAESLR